MSKFVKTVAQSLTTALKNNTTEKAVVKKGSETFTAKLERFAKCWFLDIDGDSAMVAGIGEDLSWDEVTACIETYLQV